MHSYFFLKTISFSGITDTRAGCQFHLLYSVLGQVLILLIDKLLRLPCVHLIYVMTESVIYANNSKIHKLSLLLKSKWHC